MFYKTYSLKNNKERYIKIYRKINRKMARTDIMVFRKSVKGITNSKPCVDCIETLKKSGIRGIFYSQNNGFD